jgi:GntR family transcriptional regulator
MADHDVSLEKGLNHPTGKDLLHGSVSFESVHFIIDRSKPIVGQILEQIAYLLVSGALAAGERLPTLGETAQLLGISVGTAVAIYRILGQHGIVTSTVGTGTFFTPQAQRAASRYLVSADATALIQRARALGLAEEEVVGVFLAASTRADGDDPNEESIPAE